MTKFPLILCVLLFAGVTHGQIGSAFDYQRGLNHLGAPANGTFDFQFEHFDVEVGGIAIALPISIEDLEVIDGLFIVGLQLLRPHSRRTQGRQVQRCGLLGWRRDHYHGWDDPSNSVGRFTSIAIGADGLLVISYIDETARDLVVAKCGNLACQ